MRTIIPRNPRPVRVIPLLPASLIALAIGLLVASTAGLQTDTAAPKETDRNTHSDSGASSNENGTSEPDGSPSKDTTGDTALKDHRKTINRLLDNRNYGRAMQKAFAMRRKLDGTEWSEASADYYFSVQDRIEEAYEQVKDRTGELVDRNQPYRAYRYLKTELPDFDNCAPYERRLKRKRSSLKVKVIQAYNNGELDTRPTFIPDRGSNDASQENPEEETSTEQKDKKGNPRIYAEAPTMSNAPDSPKSFEGEVVNTTENGVHFRVDFKGANSRQKMGFFLFELRGLQGREQVRIDFVNMGRWDNSKAIVPMYSRGVEELSDLTALRAHAPEDGRLEYVNTPSGQKVPITKGLQKWRYFKHTSVHEDEKRITVRKRFPQEMEHTYIAHRVPYTIGHHLEYMDKLQERARYGAEHLTVHKVGKSKDGRPLHVIELASPADPEATDKPVIVVTSGEHPDEMTTYQAMAKGAIKYLLSDRDMAKTLRRRATFLFVPVLDPDGLAKTMYENICYTFTDEGNFGAGGEPSRTSKEYAKFFRKWVNDGKRLDLHILTHNVEAAETKTHMFNYLVEPESGRHKMSMRLWRHVRDHVRDVGFRVSNHPTGTGYTSNRLGGFLRFMVGTMQLFVEFNSQPRSPARKLTLIETQKLGRHVVQAAVDFLYRRKAVPLRKDLRKRRKRRSVLADRYTYFDRVPMLLQTEEPFGIERWLHALPKYERSLKKDKSEGPDAKRWIGPRLRLLYQKHEDISPANIPNFESD